MTETMAVRGCFVAYAVKKSAFLCFVFFIHWYLTNIDIFETDSSAKYSKKMKNGLEFDIALIF